MVYWNLLKMNIGEIFCDMSKVFGCINHEILLTKLPFCGDNNLSQIAEASTVWKGLFCWRYLFLLQNGWMYEAFFFHFRNCVTPSNNDPIPLRLDYLCKLYVFFEPVITARVMEKLWSRFYIHHIHLRTPVSWFQQGVWSVPEKKWTGTGRYRPNYIKCEKAKFGNFNRSATEKNTSTVLEFNISFLLSLTVWMNGPAVPFYSLKFYKMNFHFSKISAQTYTWNCVV